MGETFRLRDAWYVLFGGKTTGGWNERGPADACLSLLRRGMGSIAASGAVRWRNSR